MADPANRVDEPPRTIYHQELTARLPAFLEADILAAEGNGIEGGLESHPLNQLEGVDEVLEHLRRLGIDPNGVLDRQFTAVHVTSAARAGHRRRGRRADWTVSALGTLIDPPPRWPSVGGGQRPRTRRTRDER